MRRIVLLIDPPRIIQSADLTRHDLEGYTPIEAKMVCSAIKTFAPVTVYTDMSQFMNRLWMHKHHLIFPLIWGQESRNTRALLPAVCEASGIPYIGPDSYTQTVFYDKYLSKKYAQMFELNTPKSVILSESQTDVEIKQMIKLIDTPMIIKPNFGGGSCGISGNNLVENYNDAIELVHKLFSCRFSPVLAEEYIPGNELSILLLGNRTGIIHCGETQLVIDGETYFDHSIWGYETKKVELQRSHYQVSHLLPLEELEKAKRLFLSLPKAEFLRIDGRLNAQGFFVLEISPDCYLGPDSDFDILYRSLGRKYSDLMLFLAENALLSHCQRNSPIT